MRFDDSFLQELKFKTDIESTVSSYVSLKRRGRTLVGLCPFHNEKTGSFTVYPESQSFYCFGCGAGGDIVSFLMRAENLDYVEAVTMLAEQYGIRLPENNFDNSLARKKSRLLEANKEAARFFHNSLKTEEGRIAMDYYNNRNLSQSIIVRFGLGYAPDKWDSLIKHMTSKGYTVTELYEANLVKKSEKNGKTYYYDNFRNRIIIPIIDLRGNVIAFGGRVLDDSKPKYVNTSDTLIYKKSNAVFALNKAKNDNGGKIILAEGYMDVIALHQAGFTNAVACLGTALTREQARLISRYADEVILAYDSDAAGKAATEKAISIFNEIDIKVRVLSLVGGKDPDEIIKKHGRERFEALINGASNDVEFKILGVRGNFDLQTTDGKIGFLNEVVKILSKIDNEIEKDLYISRLSEELSVSREAIKSQVNAAVRRRYRGEKREVFKNVQKYTSGFDDKVNTDRSKYLRAAKAEDILISTLLNNQDFSDKVFEMIKSDEILTSFNRRLFKFLEDNMQNGAGVELSAFNSDFTPDEMGYITRLYRGENISNTIKECEDCIAVIKQEASKMNFANPAEASDEAFLKMFKK